MSAINKVMVIAAKKPFFSGYFQLSIKCVQINSRVIFMNSDPLKAKIISSYRYTNLIISWDFVKKSGISTLNRLMFWPCSSRFYSKIPGKACTLTLNL
jgi:hypothetical protein